MCILETIGKIIGVVSKQDYEWEKWRLEKEIERLKYPEHFYRILFEDGTIKDVYAAHLLYDERGLWFYGIPHQLDVMVYFTKGSVLDIELIKVEKE